MDLKNITSFEKLKLAKAKFYSKEGEFKKTQKQIKTASLREKQWLGKKIQAMKIQADNLFSKKFRELEIKKNEQKINDEWIDVTEPIAPNTSLHPLTIIINRARIWLTKNGYFETIGSEIEVDEYNFERLNIPKDHPSRDMQDSLYIDHNTLLRTHNTGFTAKTLEKYKNKSFSEFTVGKVYRNDDDDQTHSHQFSQIDIASTGYVSLPNLIWTLKSLISYILESKVKLRLRPSYFPFTEPSVEVDIFYNEKWIEVLGAGILNDKVLKRAGYTNGMNGFAAGIGVERIAMIKFGINDIREFYKNDIRFLNQFKGVN